MSQNIEWTKPVCQLDADNIYIGQINAELDIYARDGSYLIPAGCIDTTPPKISAGYVARWNGSDWDIIEDHRGKAAYRKADGVAVIIDKVGRLTNDLTLLEPANEYCEWDGKKWIENQAKKAEAEETKLATAKSIALSRLNQQAQAIVNEQSGMDDLPAFEVQSWVDQAAEAREWEKNPSAPTPVIDRIAAARGIGSDDLKAAVLRKAKEYQELSAEVAGRRQALAEKIAAANTIEEIEAIKIEFDF